MQQVKINKNSVTISLSSLMSVLDYETKKSSEMLKVGKITYIINILISGHKSIFPVHC